MRASGKLPITNIPITNYRFRNLAERENTQASLNFLHFRQVRLPALLGMKGGLGESYKG